MVDISKNEVDRKYETFEIMSLAFKVVNKNKKNVLAFMGKALLALLVVAIPVGVIFSTFGVLQMDIYNEFYNATGIIEPLFAMGIFGVFAMVMLIFLAYTYTVVWFLTRGVVGTDTGIEIIESQKVQIPVGSSITKLFAVQILVSAVSIGASIISSMSQYVLPLYLTITIQIYILSFLISLCATFTYFEIVAKGKSISNSMSNAVTNLFFSKSGIMVNAIVGNLIIGIAMFILIFLFVFLGVLAVMFFAYAGFEILAIIVGIILIIVYLFVIGYLSFYSTTYSYLLYMLNQVRDDKVGNLR